MTNVINSAIHESRELRNLEKEIERGLDYENLEAIKRIADSAESQAKSSAVQAELAVKQADKAEQSSKTANIKANISFVLSSLSVMGVLLANADKIVHNVQKILSHLGFLK